VESPLQREEKEKRKIRKEKGKKENQTKLSEVWVGWGEMGVRWVRV